MIDADVRKLVFANEYDAQAELYNKAGITKESYVQSRMADEELTGLPTPLASNDPQVIGFQAEYIQNAEVYRRQGITIQQYVESRCVDEGVDTLQPQGV